MSAEPTQQQNMRRVALTSLAGTSIEWYDFFLYGTAAAVIFPKAFFLYLPPMVLLIISFSTFAVGFIPDLLAGGVRSLWRSGGPQAHVGHRFHDDGGGHHTYWALAHL